MSSDIFKNKVDFKREEFSTELSKHRGKPIPRENSSQKAQMTSAPKKNLRGDVKTPMKDKNN